MWACRFNAKTAKEADSLIALRTSNIGAIFAAGSYVEARLNEISAQVKNTGALERTKHFWDHIHKTRKDRPFIDKWNLISSQHNGIRWESSVEPFQSYDLIMSLRNELVHYKGDFGDSTKPPTKKLMGLISKLRSKDENEDDSLSDFWIDEFLNSKQLAPWIESIITEFDMKIEHMLSGSEFTEKDKFRYELRQMSYELTHNTIR